MFHLRDVPDQSWVVSLNTWGAELLGGGLRSPSASHSVSIVVLQPPTGRWCDPELLCATCQSVLEQGSQPRIAPKVSLEPECWWLFITPDGQFCRQANSLNIKA